jgi:hypothetical protein
MQLYGVFTGTQLQELGCAPHSGHCENEIQLQTKGTVSATLKIKLGVILKITVCAHRGMGGTYHREHMHSGYVLPVTNPSTYPFFERNFRNFFFFLPGMMVTF